MNLSPASSTLRPTRVRFGVLGFAGALAMITYLDRVCMGTVGKRVQEEFALDDTQLGTVFFAFSIAYALFEVPSGWLGDVFGPRKTLIRIVLWWSFFTSATGMIYPSAYWPWFGFYAMVAVRFLFGIGEAGAFPNITRAFHNWFPFHERGLAQGAVWMAGRFAGGITPLIVLALLKQIEWRHTFHLFGVIGVVWCVIFWIWFRDRPEQKASVNQQELELIHQGKTAQLDAGHSGVPWLAMLTNFNLWALCLIYFCASYGWYFNITWLPKYLDQQYGVKESTSGFWTTAFMSGAPLLFGSCACLVGGLLTDGIIKRTGNRKWGRRICGVIGHGVCALCYVLAIAAQSPWGFVLAVAFAAFWNDLTMGSSWASCIDIGRKYSGIVSGCMNTIGNLGGAAAVQMTGIILDWYKPTVELIDGKPATEQAQQALVEASRQAWQMNFILFGGVYAIAAVLWLCFDSTKPIVTEDHD